MLQSSQRVLTGLLTVGALAHSLGAAAWAQADGSVPSTPALSSNAMAVAAANGMQLRVRRGPGVVELVLEGTGPAPTLSQSDSGGVWQGQLRTATASGLRLGAQRIALPEAGFQLVSLAGSGQQFQLQVVPMPGVPLRRPVVSADGRNLVISFAAPAEMPSQTARLDLRQPGAVPQPTFAPPLQPRAVAPPLGDMAVGSMVLRNQGFVNLSGPTISLNLRGARAVDALQSLARIGGYGFVFVDDSAVTVTSAGASAAAMPGQGAAAATGGAPAPGAGTGGALSASPSAMNMGVPVTVSFVNENYSRAFNSVLMAANLQGKLDGRTIFVGPSVLRKSFGSQLSKIYRLNQASATSAADYLASLGASITKVNVITNAVTQGASQAAQVQGGPTSQQTTTQNVTTTETYGGGIGPLKGLVGTTDSRLQTITLIGEPSLVAVAENYLRHIDLRQRQVALSVKILDVNLDNDTGIANSFAFRSGNSFIVSDDGKVTATFGSASVSVDGGSTGLNPGNNQLVDRLTAVVESSSTKVIASPTLILSENADPIQGGAAVATAAGGETTASIGRSFGNEAFVTVGEQLVTSFTTQDSASGAPPVCVPVFSNAGLTFGARVSKIDDNGFVTFSLSPEISAAVGTPQDIQGCGTIRIVNKRRLDTGNLRVRDGQTLVLTGVISDDIQAQVSKWPVLGDIPFIGQFFRGSSTRRRKSELVIMVTPRIIDDTQGGGYGYGYQPRSTDAQRLLSGSM